VSVIEVAIGPGRVPGTFRVEVVDSPAGHASATVRLDVDALLRRRGPLQRAVLTSAVVSRRALPETEQPVRDVGHELFAALLGAGEVGGRYRAAEALAAERGEGLRVVLRIDSPALAGLPWEAMFDQEAGAYVGRLHQLVRHVPVASVPAPLRVEPPLRILGVVSSPRGLPALDVEKERDQLARALARLTGQGLVSVHWAPGATWADLQDLLLDTEWHVLHFTGHGDFDSSRDEGMLALEREDGRADMVAAHRLVDLLRQARPMPRLMVLNSCSGATAGATDLFSGTAAALVRGGVSAVAAMQYEISDPAAVAFARGFYAAIARGRGVDDAVSSGRVAILGLGDQTLEWVTPVLYLRDRDARLFTLPARQAGSAASDSAASDSAGHDSPAPGPSRLVRTLAGHGSRVNGVAFSPDGTLLATVSTDKTARVWKVVGGDCVKTLTGHGGWVQGVAFSPEGTLLATASTDKTARLWGVVSGDCARTVTGHADWVQGVAFSPDGTLLATASTDKTARLWGVVSGDCARTVTGHADWVQGVAFSPDGTLLATASDKTTRLWDVAGGALMRTLTGHTDNVSGMAFSPDGTMVATAGADRTARVWELASGDCLRTLTGHTDAVLDVTFSPDGTMLATASADRTARVWEAVSGGCLRTLTGHADNVSGVAFSPDGALLATASYDRTARLWG
jgi:WD40 repeat protein